MLIYLGAPLVLGIITRYGAHAPLQLLWYLVATFNALTPHTAGSVASRHWAAQLEACLPSHLCCGCNIVVEP